VRFHLVCPQCVEPTIMQSCPGADSIECPACHLVVTFSQPVQGMWVAEDPDDRPDWIWDQREPLHGAADC